MEKINVKENIIAEGAHPTISAELNKEAEPLRPVNYYGKTIPIDVGTARMRRNTLEELICRLDDMIEWNGKGMPGDFAADYRYIRDMLTSQAEKEHRLSRDNF